MEYIKIDRLLMCVLLCLHCSSQKITTSKISSNLNVEESNQCWGTSEYFKCDNEECIYKSLKCNGLQECGDGSDETFELCNRTSVSCEIPNDKEYYTNDGSWILKPILKPGTKISVNSQVIERCNPTLDGESEFNSMTCMQNGTWKVDLKNEYCTEMCTPLYSKTLDLICNHQDTFVNCSEWSNPGTVLKISCKPNYRLPRGLTNAPFEKIVCQTDGRWSEKLYYCDPVPIRQRANCSSNQHRCDDGECVDLEFTCDGVKDCNDGSDETLKLCRIQRNPCMIPNSDVGFFTHHLDDGTLVPPGTLVRIYTGVYEKCKLDDQYTYGNYWVCLPSGHWEKYTRRQYCINICPPLTSEGLNITCTYRGRKADCSKWSKPGTILKHSCKQKYALPKGVTQSSDNVVCKPNGLWSDLLPNCYSVSALQNSDDRLDNIDNNMCDGSDLKFQCKNGECISKEYKCDGIPDCSDGSDEHPYLCKDNKMKPCRIPHTHNRFYVVNSLNERVYIPSGTTVRDGYTVRKKCSPDFDDARFDSTMSCSETNWFLKTDYEFCSETCAPKTSESLDLECTFRGNKTDCSKWSKIGTVMKIACKPNYSEHTGETNLPKQLICQSNGQWSGKLYECNRDGCPPINIKSLDLNCSLYGNPANCSKWSSFGTSLRSTCKPNFRPYEDLSENPVEIYCLDSGLWSETLNGCQPVLIFGDQELDPGSLANSSGTTCTIPYSEEFNHVYDNNGSYILTSGTRVQLGSLIKQSCKPGYYQTTEYGKLMHCLGKEKWYEQSGGKLCLKKCSPMTSDSLELTCTFRGEKTDCSTFSNPGTKLKPNCLPHYSIPNGQPVTPVDLLCLNNGQWSGQLYNCTPDCGKMYENKSLLISHGDVSKFGRAPWHIGLYEMNNNSAYDLVCGGSLLSSNLVVTAAHCFESVFKTQSVIENGNKYKIGISKYNIDINYHDNNYTQIIEFRTVYLSENYRGAAWSYHNDIAVIVLSKKVTINAVVMPICIDWEMKYSVQNGSPGTVVGWGATEKGVQSPVLLEATLAFIDQKECQSLFPQYTMIDKFCAGAGSGASVEPGDSGGGLTFEHSGLQYLTGIVSLKLPSNTSTALFTEVRYHLQWLRNVYVKHSK